MKEQIDKRFEESLAVIRATKDRLAGPIAQAVEIIIQAYRRGGGLLLFGNGGSASDAQHIACELVGRFMLERNALRAQALTADASVMTALGNDYDFQSVFARQVEAAGRGGDVAIGLSTSGDSANVVAGLARARQLGMKTIALTGRGGGKCAQHADVLLDVPCDGPSCRIQEAHAVVYHVMCELIEAALAKA